MITKLDQNKQRKPLYNQSMAGVLGSWILAIVGGLFVGMTVGTTAGTRTGLLTGLICFIVLWYVGFLLATYAMSGEKAWRMLITSSAVISFLLPFSGFILSHSNFHKLSDDLFAGFFFGVVLLILGYLTGREKEVLQQTSQATTAIKRI